MFEATTHSQIRDGIARAHSERGHATRAIWTWMFGGFSR